MCPSPSAGAARVRCSVANQTGVASVRALPFILVFTTVSFSSVVPAAPPRRTAHVVRIITWDRALSDLKATCEGKSAYDPPDVVQIGTTWVGYFQDHNLLLTKPKWEVNRNGWEDVDNTRACALPYVNDARLIFYWRRLPGAPQNSTPFELHTGSWQAIVDSLKVPREGGPPFAFPIGLTLNLLHDYA